LSSKPCSLATGSKVIYPLAKFIPCLKAGSDNTALIPPWANFLIYSLVAAFKA